MYRFIRALIRVPFITVAFLLLLVSVSVVMPISILFNISTAKDKDQFMYLWRRDWDAYKSVFSDLFEQGA